MKKLYKYFSLSFTTNRAGFADALLSPRGHGSIRPCRGRTAPRLLRRGGRSPLPDPLGLVGAVHKICCQAVALAKTLSAFWLVQHILSMLWSLPARAQTSGWEQPITGMAQDILPGIQQIGLYLGIVVCIVLLIAGYSTKNNTYYKAALAAVIVTLLTQIAPGIIEALVALTGN